MRNSIYLKIQCPLDYPEGKSVKVHVQLCQSSIVCFNHYLAKEYHKENVSCIVVVFSLQFKQLQRVVTMALKFLYLVCEIKKLDLIFSSFSVRSQNHSYKNSIVFRLARHLCSSTSLVYIIIAYVCHFVL